jgi:4-amino-4-deoxy-L-arabinose transferase-like glycosyltransferase
MRRYLGKIPLALIAVTVLAFFLRTFRISQIPPSLTWDEVSIGYNAWSIMKTGRDEHGVFLPVSHFTAYGDYKPPLSVYLTVPFLLLFGLNEAAVRLPSAVFGTLTVFLTYYLVSALGNLVKGDNRLMRRSGLAAAAILAVSPWHLNLSRAGFEANIALFFLVLGIYLVFMAAKNPKLWLFAWLPFSAGIYTFNSTRYSAPILGLGLLVFFRKHIKANFPVFAKGAIIALISLLPIIPHLFSPEARLRFQEVNIFSDPAVVELSNRRIGESGQAWWAKIVYNRRIGYARSYLLHFFDHFEPWFLFIKGDGNPKFSTQDTGQLYLPDAPLLGIGIISLLAQFPALGVFLLSWLLAAIFPAGVARETPHALRILNTLPVWQIFTAFGLVKLLDILENKAGGRIAVAFGVAVYLFFVGYYLHGYYVHYPVVYAREWQYGYREALAYVNKHESLYDAVYITDNIGRPYMYSLFYFQTDPAFFLQNKNSYFDAAGFYHVTGFGKYRFFSRLPETVSGRTLFVVAAGAVPKDVSILETVYYPDGQAALEIFEKGSKL